MPSHTALTLRDLTQTATDAEPAITVGILVAAVAAFAVLAWVDGSTWWALRDTRDRTDVGRSLKAKKLAWAVVAGLLALLYTLSLLDATDVYDPGVWPRLVVRLLTITGVLLAALTGLRFRRAYARHEWGRSAEDGAT